MRVDSTPGRRIVGSVIGFRVRFKEVPPEGAGDPKIFVPRIIFLVPGFLLSCFGFWQGWRYFRLPPLSDGAAHPFRLSLNLMDVNLEPRAVAGTCAIVFLLSGAFFLTLGICGELELRKQEAGFSDPRLFVSARKFSLVAGLVGWLCIFFFVITPWLCKVLPNFVVGFIWVITAGVLWSAILRFFRRKPDRK